MSILFASKFINGLIMGAVLALITFLFAVEAIAELPPYSQSAREIKAVMENEQIENLLNPNAISQVSRKVVEGEVFYTITDDICAATVKVKRLPSEPSFAGPARFKLEIDSMVC